MKQKDYKSNNNIVYISKYHVIWCVKYRRQLLVGKVEQRLKEILHSFVKEVTSFEIIALETDKDHVHLLCSIDPQYGINKLVKLLKGKSSFILRSEFPELRTKLPTLWTNSYFVATNGGAPIATMKAYIENQQTSQRPKQQQKWMEFIK